MRVYATVGINCCRRGSGCTKKGKVGRWGLEMVQMNDLYAYFHEQAKLSHNHNPLTARHGQSCVLFTRVVVNATLTRLHQPNLSAAAQLALKLMQFYNQTISNIFCDFFLIADYGCHSPLKLGGWVTADLLQLPAQCAKKLESNLNRPTICISGC
jgi:hypothetical protein